MLNVDLTQTVKCRWCEHRETSPYGWGAALTRLFRHVVDEHREHRFEAIEDREVRA